MSKIEYIVNEVCKFYDISEEDIKGKARYRPICFPRQMAMALCKSIYSELSLKFIGNHFGNRDHSTVIHAVKTIDNLCQTDKQIKLEFDNFVKSLSSSNLNSLPIETKQMLLGICPIPKLQLEWIK
jgi:chromosomal replication initiator protein